jgi:hypothetical protein
LTLLYRFAAIIDVRSANNGSLFGNKLQSANKCLSVGDIKPPVTVSVT